MNTDISLCDKALEIIQGTNDGNDLSPGHLYLVQCVLNNHATDEGIDLFNEVHRRVAGGTYKKPWHFGVEHVTKDHESYIYWKGICVEHYTFRGNHKAERMATEALAQTCLHLESIGVEVCGSRVTSPEFWRAVTNDHPYKSLFALSRGWYYRPADSTTAIHIRNHCNPATDWFNAVDAIMIKDTAGREEKLTVNEGIGDVPYHAFIKAGFISVEIKPYDSVAAATEWLTVNRIPPSLAPWY